MQDNPKPPTTQSAQSEGARLRFRGAQAHALLLTNTLVSSTSAKHRPAFYYHLPCCASSYTHYQSGALQGVSIDAESGAALNKCHRWQRRVYSEAAAPLNVHSISDPRSSNTSLPGCTSPRALLRHLTFFNRSLPVRSTSPHRLFYAVPER